MSCSSRPSGLSSSSGELRRRLDAPSTEVEACAGSLGSIVEVETWAVLGARNPGEEEAWEVGRAGRAEAAGDGG